MSRLQMRGNGGCARADNVLIARFLPSGTHAMCGTVRFGSFLLATPGA